MCLTIAERLRVLEFSKDAWAFLHRHFTVSIPVTHSKSGVYDLTGGIYLLSNSSRAALHYPKLPSKLGDETDGKVLGSNKLIIDIDLSIFEHDLIVDVVIEPHINISAQTTHALGEKS